MANEPDNFARVVSVLALVLTLIGWTVTSCNQYQLADKAAATARGLEEQKRAWAEEQESKKKAREEFAAKPKLVVVNKGEWVPGDAYHLLIRSESTKPVRIISATYTYKWNGKPVPHERIAGDSPDNIYIEFSRRSLQGQQATFKTLVDQVVAPMKPEATLVVGIAIPEWADKESFQGTLTLDYGDLHEPLQLIVDDVRIDAVTKLDRRRGQ